MKRIGTHRARSALAVLGVVAIGLLATGAGGSLAAEKKAGGTLTIGLAEDPDALDPTLARTFVGRMVFLHMCEKLYDLNAKLEIVPQLAAAMPALSGDKKRMTIKIRRGIRFNDGTPLNAQAVKTSLDRHRTLTGSARASEISPVTSVNVVNNYTVRLNLNARYSPLTAQLADRAGMIMSPEAARCARRRGSPRARYALGPFKFTSRTAGDRIVLDKSQFYYARNKVKLDRIVFRIIVDNERPSGQLALARHQRGGSHRVDRPAGDPARQEPEGAEGDVDRLPGPLDQHRQQERDRKAVRERRHAARVKACRCGRRSSCRSTGR